MSQWTPDGEEEKKSGEDFGLLQIPRGTMVDIPRHGPGMTVVEGGALATSTGNVYLKFAMIPWFSGCVRALIWGWIHLRGEKKKRSDPTLTFLSGSLLGFSVGCLITRVFCVDYCKSRELVSKYSVQSTEDAKFRYGMVVKFESDSACIACVECT